MPVTSTADVPTIVARSRAAQPAWEALGLRGRAGALVKAAEIFSARGVFGWRPALLAGLMVGGGACAPRAGPVFPLIPAPRSVTPAPGSFRMGPTTSITLSDPDDAELRRVAEMWAAPVRAASGFDLPVGGGRGDGDIRMALAPGGDPEAYSLVVNGNGVTVTASGPAGVFHGLQTLNELLPVTASVQQTAPSPLSTDAWTIPALEIHDAPRFSYRGMHLDGGRHFMPPEFVKRYIDLMARYKFNYFHWHLTEDQGWRIEIKRYPRLTEVGSVRRETMVEKNFDPYVGDGTPYGGFYTQDQIREIVAYARDRFVTIVPEIEMPGHSLAALAAYPELACTDGPFEVATRWGVFDDIYCPKEKTFDFLENVLTEVMDLFPGKYIHIGGDEAPKTRWRESDVARAVILREGLADEHELQSWFIRRIERFLNAHGRRLIGWDEILEGGLAPNATVMSWRGIAGGIAAAREGHDVVMTPTGYLYFDHYQGDPAQEPLAIGGFTPLEKVYSFEPVPPELTPTQARHILGAQGNVWTEYISTPAYLEYMVFPRMLALSEVDWSPKDARSWPSFAARLPRHLERLDALGVRYRIPDVGGLESDRITPENRFRLELGAPAAGAIRYTLDGSEPTADSPAYGGPLSLDLGAGPVTVSARVVQSDGRMGAFRTATFRRARLRPAEPLDWWTRAAGLRLHVVEGRFRSVGGMDDARFTRATTARSIGLPGQIPDTAFGLHFTGYLRVPDDAVYTFRLTSDDGSMLRVGDTVVVDHDGPHGMSSRRGQVALAAGLHALDLRYAQLGGGRELRLEVSWNEGPFTDVPEAWLYQDPRG